MLVRVLAVAAALLVALAASPAAAESPPSCQAGQSPHFAHGIAALNDLLGPAMGEPIECEHVNPRTGDAVQMTSAGLAYYRQRTNTPTFTDGWTHWALTADGLVSWAGDSIDPPSAQEAALQRLAALTIQRDDLPPGFLPDYEGTGPFFMSAGVIAYHARFTREGAGERVLVESAVYRVPGSSAADDFALFGASLGEGWQQIPVPTIGEAAIGFTQVGEPDPLLGTPPTIFAIAFRQGEMRGIAITGTLAADPSSALEDAIRYARLMVSRFP